MFSYSNFGLETYITKEKQIKSLPISILKTKLSFIFSKYMKYSITTNQKEQKYLVKIVFRTMY